MSFDNNSYVQASLCPVMYEMQKEVWYESVFILSLQRLESSCLLGSLEEVSAVVELLQESSQWFPGGSKQMKVLVIPYECFGERAGFF